MRRFDHEYSTSRRFIDGGELGQPLVMHCVHRNPAVPADFDSSMIVKDSLVHEVDVTRFLFGEEIAIGADHQAGARIPVRREGLQDPQIAILRTVSGATSTWSCSSPPGSPTRYAPRLSANSAARRLASTSG